MLIDDVVKQWNKDAPIDELDLKKSSLEIPKLHAKYIELYSQAKILKLKVNSRKKKLYIILKEYYSGESNTPTELKNLNREPFKLTLLKSQLDQYIDADPEMIDISLAFGYQNELVDLLEQIIKSINLRGFAIKNALDYMKFMGGG
jgi:hypothetical protein